MIFHRVESIRRYIRALGAGPGIRAEAAARRKNGIFAVKLPHGRQVWLRGGTSDSTVFEDVFITQHYKIPDYVPLSPSRIVDAGANIGLASLYFAGRWPEAEIVAIEPEADNFKMLRRNVADLNRITLVEAGIWSNSEVRLAIANPSTSNKWGLQTKAEPDGGIAATTIPAIMAGAAWERIDLLKLDVEGAERFLFDDSCHLWLRLVDVLIIELHDRFNDGCSRAFYRAISRYDFRQYLLGESLLVDFRG